MAEKKMRAEWRKGVDFHELAEALEIRTTQIMAASATTGSVVSVVYTPEVEEDDLDPETPVFGVQLARDEDGIYRRVTEPVMLAFNWLEMREQIEATLREELG